MDLTSARAQTLPHEWFLYPSRACLFPSLPMGECPRQCGRTGFSRSCCLLPHWVTSGMCTKGSRCVPGNTLCFVLFCLSLWQNCRKRIKASTISLGWALGHCGGCLEPCNLISRFIVFCLPDSGKISSLSRDNRERSRLCQCLLS